MKHMLEPRRDPEPLATPKNMLNKLLETLTGRAPIPAPTSQRLELARLILSFRLERDTPCREHFDAMGLGPADFSLDELFTFQDGLLIKLTEQHLIHMDEYLRVREQMSKEDFSAAHVRLLNSAHHAMANEADYEIPLDESLRTIQDYIAHFFRYMPEDIQFPFPPHLIHPAVELVTRFYRR